MKAIAIRALLLLLATGFSSCGPASDSEEAAIASELLNPVAWGTVSKHDDCTWMLVQGPPHHPEKGNEIILIGTVNFVPSECTSAQGQFFYSSCGNIDAGLLFATLKSQCP